MDEKVTPPRMPYPRLLHLETKVDGADAERIADAVLWPDGHLTAHWRRGDNADTTWHSLEAFARAHHSEYEILFDDEAGAAGEPSEFTQRGFAIYARIPVHVGTLRVQESSIATESAVWLFHEGASEDGDPHLSMHAAVELRDALNRFIWHRGI